MISIKYECYFLHIPKTAGTSIASAFGFGKVHRSYEDLRKHAQWGKWHSFAVVRNPWERLLSAYSYLKRRHERPYVPGMSFGCFLRLGYESYNPGLYDGEDKTQFWWATQSDWLVRDNEVVVKQIIRFDNLHEEFAKMSKRFNLNLILPHVNSSDHVHYRHYYNREDLEIVRKWFAEDIDRFGFGYEKPLTRISRSAAIFA